MFKPYERITRLALNLVQAYSHGPTSPDGPNALPASQAWPYFKSHLHPLQRVLAVSVMITILSASIEVWVISYAGRLIDMLADTALSEIWNSHRWNLLGAAAMIMVLRPMMQFARHAVNDIGIQCNVANLFRWRAHNHLTQ